MSFEVTVKIEAETMHEADRIRRCLNIFLEDMYQDGDIKREIEAEIIEHV